MTQPNKENTEKAKALRKLLKKWLTTQGTQEKADLLLAKNPEIMARKPAAARKLDEPVVFRKDF
ncbi:MAG: hypothetical protein JST42_25475 [Bacteroidetes bacterium]|nr:hypothetical protein [Bacteroidota bacterium]